MFLALQRSRPVGCIFSKRPDFRHTRARTSRTGRQQPRCPRRCRIVARSLQAGKAEFAQDHPGPCTRAAIGCAGVHRLAEGGDPGRQRAGKAFAGSQDGIGGVLANTQPDDQCGWRAFGGDKLDHGGDPGIDLRAGRNRSVQHGDQRAKALLIRVGDVLEDFSLVAKVRIERGSPGSGSLGDLIESGGCIALGMEQFPRGVADVGAGKFLARRCQRGLLGRDRNLVHANTLGTIRSKCPTIDYMTVYRHYVDITQRFGDQAARPACFEEMPR